VTLPPEAAPLLALLAAEVTAPTAAPLTTGRRTVAGVLRTLRHLAPGHVTAYRRVLSRAEWSGLALGCALARLVVARLPEGEPVRLVGDDTGDGPTGRTAHGKARHRDPVRSSRAFPAWRYGHRGVVLAVLVGSPLAARPRPLPVLADLHRSAADDAARGRPHRPPAQLLCRLLRLLPVRLPGRRFVSAGDAAYGTHEVARFRRRHRGRRTLVGTLHPEANLYDPPGRYRGVGRPPVKGARRAKPSQAAGPDARRDELTVDWYGGGKRRVGGAGEVAHRFQAGRGLVELRWVSVPDRTGTHRDEYLYATDPALHRWRSSATTAGVGTSRPPYGRCAPTWARRRPGAGARRRPPAPPRACSGRTRRWPWCPRRRPRASGPAGSSGRARRPRPALTR